MGGHWDDQCATEAAGGFASPCAAQCPCAAFGCSGSNADSSLYTIDPLTGASTLVGAMGITGCSGLAFQPGTNTLFAVGKDPGTNKNSLFTVDPVTGVATLVGATGIEALATPGFFRTISDISFRRSDGTLYAWLEASHGLGTLDPTSGAATFLGFPGSSNCCGQAIAFDRTSDVLFHAGNDSLNTLDQTTGAATEVAKLTFPQVYCPSGFPRINALDFFPQTGPLYGSLNCANGGDPVYLTIVDTTTGTNTADTRSAGSPTLRACSRILLSSGAR
jgi:hypothetical protein